MLGSRADTGPTNDDERAFELRCRPFIHDGRAYAETHRTTPQTLAYAMIDNPVAQAAWIVDKFHAWSDLRGGKDLTEVHSLDTLLTNLMFYVATDSFPTATWIYRAAHTEGIRQLPPGSHIEVPTGFASFPCEIRPRPPRGLLEKHLQRGSFQRIRSRRAFRGAGATRRIRGRCQRLCPAGAWDAGLNAGQDKATPEKNRTMLTLWEGLRDWSTQNGFLRCDLSLGAF